MLARGEYHEDKNGILSGLYPTLNGVSAGLKASGFAFGLQVNPTENSFIRTEARILKTDSDLIIFTKGNTFSESRTEITLGTGIVF